MSAMTSDFDTDTAQPVVYVRAVPVNSLPHELREQAMGATTIYAVHDEEGERLALVRDRGLAFTLARQSELTPVSVH